MVNEKLLRQKLGMWTKKLSELEKENKEMMAVRSEEASKGDLQEDTFYQSLIEKDEFISARIRETKKIILEIKSQLGEENTTD